MFWPTLDPHRPAEMYSRPKADLRGSRGCPHSPRSSGQGQSLFSLENRVYAGRCTGCRWAVRTLQTGACAAPEPLRKVWTTFPAVTNGTLQWTTIPPSERPTNA